MRIRWAKYTVSTNNTVRYDALLAAAPPSFSVPNYRSGIPGRGGWDEDFATLGDRHYNRHAGLARCRVPAEAL